MGEYSMVAPRLWVGSAPEPHEELVNFDLVVFAAEDWQPKMVNYRGAVERCGIADSFRRPISDHEKRKVEKAARLVAQVLFDGGRALCTCQMGWNRSSLVAACALKRSTNWPVSRIVEVIRDARGEDALTNDSFVAYLLAGAPVT